MEVKDGYVYHIKDSYFAKVNDNKLMSNKDNGKFRPTYFCFRDLNTNLIWVVPMSSKYKKYKAIAENKAQKYGKCDTIILGKFDGQASAFLIQNMFPITEAYLDHAHTRNNNPVPVNYKLKQEIFTCANKVLLLTRKGYNLVFPDVLRLEKIMLQELSLNSNKVKSSLSRNQIIRNAKAIAGQKHFSNAKDKSKSR